MSNKKDDRIAELEASNQRWKDAYHEQLTRINHLGVEIDGALRGRLPERSCQMERLQIIAAVAQRVEQLRRERDEAAAQHARIVDCVTDLIESSHGVAGLHGNGDIAEWSEIMQGGQFEEWLLPLSETPAVSLVEVRAQAIDQFAEQWDFEKEGAKPFILFASEYADRIRKEAK